MLDTIFNLKKETKVKLFIKDIGENDSYFILKKDLIGKEIIAFDDVEKSTKRGYRSGYFVLKGEDFINCFFEMKPSSCKTLDKKENWTPLKDKFKKSFGMKGDI